MPDPCWRYVGGKSWLVDNHGDLLPTADEIRRRGGIYREPFVGGGAVVLGRYAGRCPVAISDANGPVVRAYRAIRDDVEALIEALAKVAPTYDRAVFERYREGINAGTLRGLDEAVAVFVILAWGYNGLWRLAKNGRLNTPFGKPSKPGAIPKLFDAANLRAVAVALVDAVIRELDFEAAAAEAQPGDYVFFDPVYEPASDTADFTAYAGGWRVCDPAKLGQRSLLDAGHASDLERLAWVCEQLGLRGVEWGLTNADVPVVRRVFERWPMTRLEARRSVSSKADTRGPVGELFITNRRMNS